MRGESTGDCNEAVLLCKLGVFKCSQKCLFIFYFAVVLLHLACLKKQTKTTKKKTCTSMVCKEVIKGESKESALSSECAMQGGKTAKRLPLSM